MTAETVFAAAPRPYRSYELGISKPRVTYMNAGILLPFVTYKRGLFLRVHIYKLIRVLEGEFP